MHLKASELKIDSLSVENGHFVRSADNLAHVRERRTRVNFRGGFSSVACDAILLCLRPHGRQCLSSLSLLVDPYTTFLSFLASGRARARGVPFNPPSIRASACICVFAREDNGSHIILYFASGKRTNKTVISFSIFAFVALTSACDLLVWPGDLFFPLFIVCFEIECDVRKLQLL